MQSVESTQAFGLGFCKYFELLLQAVHLELSFPTVQDAANTTPYKVKL